MSKPSAGRPLVPDGRSARDESWLRYVYLAQAVDDHDRRRGPLQRSTGLIEEELMDRKNPEPLWTPTQVATYLGVPVQTLYQWRRKHTGPPARRVGRHLRYDPSTVQAWFAALGDGVA